jgi:hypothetical protein
MQVIHAPVVRTCHSNTKGVPGLPSQPIGKVGHASALQHALVRVVVAAEHCMCSP